MSSHDALLNPENYLHKCSKCRVNASFAVLFHLPCELTLVVLESVPGDAAVAALVESQTGVDVAVRVIISDSGSIARSVEHDAVFAVIVDLEE